MYCIGSLLYNALELQVRMKFGVVTKVSTFSHDSGGAIVHSAFLRDQFSCNSIPSAV